MEKIIKKLLNEIDECEYLKVAAVVYSDEEMIPLFSEHNSEIPENLRRNSKKKASVFHAEQVLVDNNFESISKLSKKQNLNLIVNIPPCEHCMKFLNDKNLFKKVQYVDKYGLEYKLERLAEIYNLTRDELNFTLEKFNPNENKDLINLVNEISKSYLDYFIVNYLIFWYKLNWEFVDDKYVYIKRKEYFRHINSFEIIKYLTGERNMYTRKNKTVKINVDSIKKWYLKLDESFMDRYNKKNKRFKKRESFVKRLKVKN